MVIRILRNPINRDELQKIAHERFGDLVKAAVDIEKGVMALGSEMHIDAETELIEKEGSLHENVWGINLYPANKGADFVEFDSMINLKPAFGNRTRGIDDENIRNKVLQIVARLVSD